uniref:Uncharacterized protein n=1 Tax=Vibrio tasmaniensis TaxID=212663 RepID=A0A0H3ZPV1_9VIBR|nr:hypothetical protein [Vibrio tasmaniensis]
MERSVLTRCSGLQGMMDDYEVLLRREARTARKQPFRLRRPLPIFKLNLSDFRYRYGRFQIGICLLPFRAALRCELGFTPPFRSHNTNHLFLSRLSPLAATRGGFIERLLSSD